MNPTQPLRRIILNVTAAAALGASLPARSARFSVPNLNCPPVHLTNGLSTIGTRLLYAASSGIRLLLMILILPTETMADSVGWHDHFGGDVGLGLDLRNQSVTKPRVAIFDTANLPPYSGTGAQSINAFFAQHTLDTVKSFSLNANVSLQYTMYSGNIGFSFADQQTFSQNTLNFVFDCTRDFGNTAPAFVRLDPDFTSVVNSLKQTLSGSALHQAITDIFGTHVVYGYQSSAKAVVVYQFQYGSSSIARSTALTISANYSSGFNSASFDAFVQDQFSQTDTRTTLSAQFWSSDPNQPPSFPLVTNLTSYSQFVNYAGQVQSYCASMNPARFKKTGFLIEPIQNLPGYLTLVGGFSPTNLFNTGYEQFIQTYARLKAWENLLLGWTLDSRHMSWLNTGAQQQVLAMRADVSQYRRAMEASAKAYFENGTPLTVSDSLINYFVNFNRLPVPTINILAAIPESDAYVAYCGAHAIVGYVNCGPLSLTQANPFPALFGLTQGAENGDIEGIYYSMDDFAKRLAEAGGTCRPYQEFFDRVTTSPQWAKLRDDATHCRIGCFIYAYYTGWATTRSLVIKDAAGRIVEEQNLLTRQATACGELAQGASQVNLALLTGPPPTSALPGSVVTYQFAVTNQGPGTAYGVSFSVPAPVGFDVIRVSGSQGQLTANQGGIVTYDIGPLAVGSAARVQIEVIPKAGVRVASLGEARVSLGSGLLDPVATDNSATVPPISITLPRLSLSIVRSGGQIELSWTSAANGVVVEESDTLSNSPQWRRANGSILFDRNVSTTHQTLGTGSKFYRLIEP